MMPEEVLLSRGLVALIDSDDLPRVATYRWSAVPSQGTWYARRTIREPGHPKTSQNMHTLLTGWPLTDHVNGNGLDNRRENLRPATSSGNRANALKVGTTNTSCFKGVYWRARERRWTAMITVNSTRMNLGSFVDEAEAAHAYDVAARAHFGEFAAVNFPGPGERSALNAPPAHQPLKGVAYGRRKRASASSAYLGVSWNKAKSLWVARIGRGGHLYLGAYSDELAAAAAYDAAAREHFGAYAELNFPKSGVDQ